MTDLEVLLVVSNVVLAAGLVGVIGEFLVKRLGDHQLARRVANEHLGPGGAERPVTPSPA